MRWSDVRDALVASADWPTELEQAMTVMASGQLPPPLSPFRTPSGIFIPVIVKAEIVDRVLRKVFVIFVPADAERLGGLFESSSLPMGMPARLKSLVHLMRLMFRARWDIVEPRRAEATDRNPSKDRCVEIVGLVFSDFDELNRDLASLHLNGHDAFREVFDTELLVKIEACSQEWLALAGPMRIKPPDNPEALAGTLTALQSNNGKRLSIGATQVIKSVSR